VPQVKLLLLLIVATAGIVAPGLQIPGEWQQLVTSASIEGAVEYLQSFWPWTPVIAIVFLTLETVIAPLPAWPVLGANALIFGLWGGIAVSWAGAMLGAVICFWISRSFGRRWLERKLRQKYLHQIDEFSSRKGFWILLLARVIPVTSLDVLSYLAGLSRIPFWHFLAATGLGFLPGVTLYTLFAHDLFMAQHYGNRLSLVGIGLVAGYLLYHYRRVIIRRLKASKATSEQFHK